MKDELGGKIVKELLVLRAKTYIYSIDDSSEDKNLEKTKSMS